MLLTSKLLSGIMLLLTKHLEVIDMKHTPYTLLKAALREKRITYRDISRLLKISTSAVSKKINGVSDFYVSEVMRMEEAFGLCNDFFIC